MTANEYAEATRRLRELDEKGLLPAETIADLKRWWSGVLKERREGKVIELPWVRSERSGRQ